MRPLLFAALVSLLPLASAEARSTAWFAEVGEVTLPDSVDVPLYRGDHGEHRPLVRVVTPGKRDREIVHLAVLDIAHGWSKIGFRTARQLGLTPEETKVMGRYAQVAVIPELRVGELVIRDLPVEVVYEEVFVLGTAPLQDVATAILPSEGTVRFVPAAKGEALVQELGGPLPIQVQSRKKWKHRGEKVYGNGFAVSVEGALGGEDGWLALRTDEAQSLAVERLDGTRRRRRGGQVQLRARGRIGTAELAESWVARDESLSDAEPTFVGSLGYDQLYAVDLAVSPADGLVAARKALRPTWERAEPVRLEVARAAHKAAGLPSEDERVDRPPRMGFGGAKEDPKGDPGDTSTLRLERDLAMALWDTGELEEAIPFFLRASEAGGDACGPHMELGLKRLRWSGVLQEQDFIVELIRQPLREAGELWDRWDALEPKTREAIRTGQSVGDEVFQVPQERRCLTAWGTLMAAYVAQGNTAASSAIYTEHYGSDPLVAYAQGLSLLEQGQAKVAEIPIREALSFDVEEKGDIKLGLGRAQALQGLSEPVEALAKEVPAIATEAGFTAALMVVEWGDLLEEAEPADLIRDVVKTDPYWIPGQLVAIWLELEQADPTQLKAELVRQQARDAGSTEIEVYGAVLDALDGDTEGARKALRKLKRDRPPTADLFAALAFVASLDEDAEALSENLQELRLRYPTLAFDTLGLPVPAPAEPDAEGI